MSGSSKSNGLRRSSDFGGAGMTSQDVSGAVASQIMSKVGPAYASPLPRRAVEVDTAPAPERA